MPDINYVNPQINNTTHKDISIQVSLSGFSFLIKSSNSGSCLVFRHYKLTNVNLIGELVRKTEGIMVADKYLNDSFQKVEVTYISQKSTLIPKPYFNTESVKTYFEFNHTLNELDELHFIELDSIEAYNVYSIPNYLTNTFYNSFPNVTFNQQASHLINFGYKDSTNGVAVYVALNPGFFDIAIFEEKQLLLHNSFSYTNTRDFIYFFLYPFNQLKVDPASISVTLVGETSKHKEILSELKELVKSVVLPENISQDCKHLSYKQRIEFFNLFQ